MKRKSERSLPRLECVSPKVQVLKTQFPDSYGNGVWKYGLCVEGIGLDAVWNAGHYNGIDGFINRGGEIQACTVSWCDVL